MQAPGAPPGARAGGARDLGPPAISAPRGLPDGPAVADSPRLPERTSMPNSSSCRRASSGLATTSKTSSRPRHLGHASTSSRNVRRRSRGQSILGDRANSAPCPSCFQRSTGRTATYSFSSGSANGANRSRPRTAELGTGFLAPVQEEESPFPPSPCAWPHPGTCTRERCSGRSAPPECSQAPAPSRGRGTTSGRQRDAGASTPWYVSSG